MLNLNLLPPKEKLSLSYEMKTRAVLAVAAGLVIAFVVAAVLLLPAFFILSSQRANVMRTLDLEMEKNARSGVGAGVGELSRVNALAKAVIGYENNRPRIYELFEGVFGAVPQDVTLKDVRLRLADKNFVVDGFASTRPLLLGFVRGLEQNPQIKSVSLPVINLVKGTNINFFLSAVIK